MISKPPAHRFFSPPPLATNLVGTAAKGPGMAARMVKTLLALMTRSGYLVGLFARCRLAQPLHLENLPKPCGLANLCRAGAVAKPLRLSLIPRRPGPKGLNLELRGADSVTEGKLEIAPGGPKRHHPKLGLAAPARSRRPFLVLEPLLFKGL